MHENKHKLIFSAGMIGFFTLLSRVFGLIRDILSASLFGTSRIWDAFVLAFTFPNLLRRLVFEGALSSAFIPIFVKIQKEKGKEAAQEFANQVGTGLFWLILILTICFYGSILLLHSFNVIQGKWGLVVEYSAYLFPYLFFMLAASLTMGILNSEKHFFTPALSPMVLNLSWVLAVLIICPLLSNKPEVQVKYLCIIIVISGFLQLVIQWYPLWKRKYVFKLTQNLSTPELARFKNMILPAVLGLSVFNINVLADLVFGYFLSEGVSSSIWYSSRLMQFPLGIFAASLGTVLLPEYSHQVASDNRSMIQHTLSFSLRSVLLIIVPAAVGMIVLAKPIIHMLFERGQFTEASTLLTSNALICYSIGLVVYSGLPVIVSAFYASQSLKSPVIAGVFAVVLNLILNVLLMYSWRGAGLALSTSISGFGAFILLLVFFYRESGDFEVKRIAVFLFKIFAVSLIMGLGVSLVFKFWTYNPFAQETINFALRVLVSIISGVALYAAGCFALRIHEMRRMKDWILGKK